MVSFFAKLFGFTSGSSEEAQASTAKAELYADCLIRAIPQKDGAQYRLAGSIEKEIDGQTRVRTFIRADLFSAQQDATDAAFRKAHQIIDQTGPALFVDTDLSRNV